MKLAARLALATAVSAVFAGSAFAENIKIAFIDPLSGPFAATGVNGVKQFEHAIDVLVNDQGGVLGGRELELVPFDNKISAQESLVQLQVAIDQGIRFIAQGNSSGVANALTDAINKHNRRNPEDRVLFLNYSAVDPALTNDKCNFWHFRFDAHAGIKMDALTDVMAENEDLSKVYIIGQDYSFGKAVAAAAVSNLETKRPDVEIVGNELHPIGKVKDFTPYARKIVASEADAVITGNWGSDMIGLGKAILESGFDGPIYTYYAAADGITATFGEAGKGSLRLVAEGQLNPPPSPEAQAIYESFKARHPEPEANISQARVYNTIKMLSMAIEEAGTADDVVAVADALSGMETEGVWGGMLKMREQDHQLIQNVHIMAHTDENITFDYDGSGFGVYAAETVEMASADIETTCKMRRP
ncbi:MAG: branched-chain amino acid ABC transporter substrate-binding protein [Pseudomonadota bacterium]